MTAITTTSTASSLSTTAPVLGYMPMPADFPYRDILRRGRPRHGKNSTFLLRHPSMPCSKRAKIFAPFDALAGFDERIAAKEILYQPRRQLSQEEKEELNQKLTLLHRLAWERKHMKNPAPQASVTFFDPCNDPENEAYGLKGTYKTIQGPVSHVDPVITKTLLINHMALAMEDLVDIQCSELQ